MRICFRFDPVMPANYVYKSRADVHQNWRPVDYFKEYFDEEVVNMMCQHTNMHHVRRIGRPLGATPAEIQRFLGVSLLMGCIDVSCQLLGYMSVGVNYFCVYIDTYSSTKTKNDCGTRKDHIVASACGTARNVTASFSFCCCLLYR